MRITKHTDYALRVLLYLAVRSKQGAESEVVPTARIAEAFGISENHLTKVARRLSELGLVTSKRGVGGGLTLALEPTEVSVGAVMRAFDRAEDLIECFDEATDECVISPACGLKAVLGEAQEAFFATLDPVTLAELVHRRRAALAKLLEL